MLARVREAIYTDMGFLPKSVSPSLATNLPAATRPLTLCAFLRPHWPNPWLNVPPKEEEEGVEPRWPLTLFGLVTPICWLMSEGDVCNVSCGKKTVWP